MLEELEIHNLGPIRQANLGFGTGMTAITGETGAGKSMLLDAIRLISGANVSTSRTNAADSDIWAQGIFHTAMNSTASTIAQRAGVEPEDGELFLTRSLPSHKRSRAVLNGHTVPRSLLHDIGSELVTIHGQSDQMKLASNARQRDMLDRYARNEAFRQHYAQAWEELKALDERLKTLNQQQDSAHERAQYLEESIAAIDAISPHSGELEELKSRREHIENAATIAQGVNGALKALDISQLDSEDDQADASSLIHTAIRALEGIGIGGVFSQSAQRLRSVHEELSDIVFNLSGQLNGDDEEGDLDAINARIHSLSELIHQWGPGVDDVLAWKEHAQLELEDLQASPEHVAELQQHRVQLVKDAIVCAAKLSQSRLAAAQALSKQVSAELASLAMQGATLEIAVHPKVHASVIDSLENEKDTPDTVSHGDSHDDAAQDSSVAMLESIHKAEESLDPHGFDDIEFLFTPFPGSQQLPMGKSASGGELSRLMLALELSMAAHDDPDDERHHHEREQVFIFDEVDAGVGGKAAVELGKRLAILAQRAQVIVVTHLAQVASWAHTQFTVSKGVADESSQDSNGAAIETLVRKVEGSAREHEIARMLAGSESTTSLQHAKELLNSSIIASHRH